MCHLNPIKYLIFVFALLPKLAESANCRNHKRNATIQGKPIITLVKGKEASFYIKYTNTFLALYCCTFGNPSPTLIWYQNDTEIDPYMSKFRLMSNNQSLWMPSLKTKDSAIYTCKSSNKYGSTSRRFKVVVKSSLEVQKPVVTMRKSWIALVGSNVTLTCIVRKSSTMPQVVWHLNSTSTRPLQKYTGRHFVSLKGWDEKQSWISNLTINNVTMADRGNYICVARNGAARVKDDGILTVKEPMQKKPIVPHQKETTQKEQKTSLIIGAVLSTFFLFALVTGLIWLYKNRSYPSICARIFGINTIVQPPDADFDVFISYSSQDRDFVKTVLYDELSKSYRVCIDFKDFEAGLYIGDNIHNCIFRSRKTLLVVSENFLNGEWTHFEMQIAQGRIAQGHDVLIPVIIEDISYNNLPKALKLYRKTKTYLEYFNEDVRPHFWDRLRNALGPSLQEYEDQEAAEDALALRPCIA